MKLHRRYPLNCDGDFYVVDDMCMACTAPEQEAPDLIASDPKAHAGYHCYFKRQPETAPELERAIKAVWAGCCGAVRYGGTNPTVIRLLLEHGVPDACDALARETA